MALTEGKHTGEFLLAEAPGTISRDPAAVIVPSATTLAPGTVLGQLAEGGAYAPYDDAQSDGSETAAAVLYGELRNEADEAASIDGVVINAVAEVRAADLVWGEGVDTGKGLADLRAVGIKAR